MAETPVKQKATATGVRLQFGDFPLGILVDLVKANPETKEVKFKSVCPLCATKRGTPPSPVNQVYLCSQDKEHGPFTTAEIAKTKEIDGKLYPVSAEELEQVKQTTLPEKQLSLSVFPAPQVELFTRPTGSTYRLRPSKGTRDDDYLGMAEVLHDKKLAFIGELVMKGTQKLYRVEAWGNQLVAQELVRPDELAPRDPLLGSADKKAVKMIKDFVGHLVEDFKPEDFKNKVRERAMALDTAKLSGKPTKVKKTPQQTSISNLEAMLQESLNSVKKKRAS